MRILANNSFRLNLSLFLLVVLFLLVSFGRNAYSSSCMPTCDETDGRFLLVVVGPGFDTLTTATLNIRITVPAGSTEFSFGIFDGDSNPFNGNWDSGAPTLFDYTLRADPDMDNGGQPVFMTESAPEMNNAWSDYTLPTHPAAMDENGDFVYTLIARAVGPIDPFPFLVSNAFKLRSSGLIEIDEIFTFTSNLTGGTPDTDPLDQDILFPNLNLDDGLGPEDRIGQRYDGTFSFFFEILEDSIELEIWDGDSDRGNFDGTQFDGDDPNTPNSIPDFAPPETDVTAEGVNPPSPFDDKDPTPNVNAFLTLQEGAVSYRILFPDGQEFHNDNPSGNREWEKVLLSTISGDPGFSDALVPSIPAGQYEIRFEGLDGNNFVSLRPLRAVTGEVIPDDDNPTAVPTMSEWGLLTLVALFGIIGVYYTRRYKKSLN